MAAGSWILSEPGWNGKPERAEIPGLRAFGFSRGQIYDPWWRVWELLFMGMVYKNTWTGYHVVSLYIIHIYIVYSIVQLMSLYVT